MTVTLISKRWHANVLNKEKDEGKVYAKHQHCEDIRMLMTAACTRFNPQSK